MASNNDTQWVLVPGSAQDIAAVRERCRRLVRRRAVWSAGMAAVPIPGVDVVSDLRLFALLIEDVNQEFGLSAEQIARLQPQWRMLAYEAAVGAGGMLVGKIVTRDVVTALLRRSGGKLLARQAGKLVPIAGQLASAAIGYTVFRQLGYQHVEACAVVAQQLLAGRMAAAN